MSQTYQLDHFHIVCNDPKTTADYFHKMFDAKVIESVQDGKPRIDLDLDGITIFLLKTPEGENVPLSHPTRYRGLDHFGLRVKNLDKTAAELKRRGVEFIVEPRSPRPGMKMAFIRGPENVRIELLERQ